MSDAPDPAGDGPNPASDGPDPAIPFPPMEAELVRELPAGGGWQYEPKWDVFNVGETMFPPRAPFFLPRRLAVVHDSSVRRAVRPLRSGGAGQAGTSVGETV